MATFFASPATRSSSALALTSSLMILADFQYFIRLCVELSSSFASVERMQEYSKLPQEPSL